MLSDPEGMSVLDRVGLPGVRSATLFARIGFFIAESRFFGFGLVIATDQFSAVDFSLGTIARAS